MTQQMKRYELLLKCRRHRWTIQRQTILNVLEESKEHLTIEQLLERVQDMCPPITLSTIYRNVELLTDMGVVRINHFPGEGATYELSSDKPHVHLVCHSCHEVTHLDSTQFEKLQADLQIPSQFHVISLALMVTGYCHRCWNQLSSEQALEAPCTDEHSLAAT
jgi:Fur family transcriptional regulator, ferric uptake regulator